MLDKSADEALHRAEQRPVNHDHSVPVAILADIVDIEALRQVEIELNCRTRPLSSERIDPLDVNLWPVKGAATFVDLVVDVALLERDAELVRSAIPCFVVTDRFVGSRGQVRVELVSELLSHIG